MGYDKEMKTTMEISDELFRAVKSRSAERGIPMRQFIEAALRAELEKTAKAKPFKLQNASFDGGGLREGVSWDRLLDFAYEDDPQS
jgi:hypothetical protein